MAKSKTNYEPLADRLDAIRRKYERRYRRRLFWRRVRWIAQDIGRYIATFVSATILAVAYIATIAILCGY